MFSYRIEKNRGIYFVALLSAISAFTFAVDAQGQRIPTQRRAVLTAATATGISAPVANNINQCQNGKASAPVACSGANYASGSLQQNNSHYLEGDSIPYQITLTAPANSTGNTVTLNWDATKGGIRAIDYLTGYDKTETVANGNDPCTGTGADCALKTTTAIPDDPDISVDSPGQFFTMFGGTITAVSPYTKDKPDYSGDTQRSITLTFSMGPNAGVAILAVAGHAAKRSDWGGLGSVNIQGSPFHFDAGNNQAQVSVGALTAPATINIVKLVHNFNGTQLNPNVSFGFTSVGGPLPATFSLIDNDASATVGGVKTATTITFGTSFTVTEDIPNPPNGYSFTQGSCVVAGGGFPIASTATPNIGVNRVATITAGEGNIITCTYENASGAPTAAKVTVSGRVTDIGGRAIRGVRVSLMDDRGATQTVLTNSFGYYTFSNVEAGRAYVMSASSRQGTFASKLLTVVDGLGNVDFIAD